jgi:parallel beta-helix repeat protein
MSRVPLKIISLMAFMIILASVSSALPKVQSAQTSGTIYIRADGSVDPSTAPMFSIDNVTYAFTRNIGDQIVVERSKIIIDGEGYTLQGSGSGYGLSLFGSISNVTMRNTNIKGFELGIWLRSSSNHSIVKNTITNNAAGIWVTESSSNNNIRENNITANSGYGILLGDGCSNNGLFRNNVSKNDFGIVLGGSLYDTIVENSIGANEEDGIWLSDSSNYNSIIGNNITANNRNGIGLRWSSNNSIYHNNFIDNKVCAYIEYSGYPNVWNNGYPSGGNYWSDYAGADANHDGIGDTAYVIDASNIDYYPLMTQYIIPEFPSFFILTLFMTMIVLLVMVYRRKYSGSCWRGR